MSLKALKPQLLLGYKEFYGVEPPKNRLLIISHVSKEHLLYELAALNYRLKPKNQLHIDATFETQVRELKYFTMTHEIFSKYARIAERYTSSKDHYPIIFSRQACLFAIEEIINSEEMATVDDFVMARTVVWESIVKYLLAVNSTITQIKSEEDDNIDFETLNPKLIPLNELLIETNQIFTPYRGYHLIKYFIEESNLGDEIISYIKEAYGFEPYYFIYRVLAMYLVNTSENPTHDFFYYVVKEEQQLFDVLSTRYPNDQTYKLLSIRKSPFIKVGDLKYLLADNSFLIEKTYSQLLNDFWFDRIKNIKNEEGKLKYNIRDYRSIFGYFFESYLTHLLQSSYSNYKHSILLTFDQLKTKVGSGHIEIADMYLRYNNKILLGQVKSGSIYDLEKYGGSVDSLYKNDRDKFFENFGVNQIVESLTLMDTYINQLDSKFPKGRSYEVYPCVVVNDKAFQTPLMADTFNKRFQELLQGFRLKKVRVKSLSLIHISDLERMEDTLSEKPKEIWTFLRYNTRDKQFTPPFYNTLNKLGINRQYPARVKALFKSLIEEYSH